MAEDPLPDRTQSRENRSHEQARLNAVEDRLGRGIRFYVFSKELMLFTSKV
jgi:hypothetical protein